MIAPRTKGRGDFGFIATARLYQRENVLLSLHPQASNPACLILIAAFMSLSWYDPHSGHVHSLSLRERFLLWYPQSEHGLVVAVVH